jgi:formylglycine-generating enzyme required for sulfatase activity
MKKTKRIVVLAIIVVLLVIVGWGAWAWNQNSGVVKQASDQLDQGEFAQVATTLEGMVTFPLNGMFGYEEQARALRDLAGRMQRIGQMNAAELLQLEAEVRAGNERHPTLAGHLAPEVEKRLAATVPDPFWIDAEQTLVLREGHPVVRITVGEQMLAAKGDRKFDATGLADAAEPRSVKLEDPHGFTAEVKSVIRVDAVPPKITSAKAPGEVAPGQVFEVALAADQPVVEVRNATVAGGKLMGAACREATATIRIAPGVPPEDGVGLVTWACQVRDASGNVSEMIQGKASSVPAHRLQQAAGLSLASPEDLLELEAWTRKHAAHLPETGPRVAAEVAKRLQAEVPGEIALSANRIFGLQGHHPVAALRIDGKPCEKLPDGRFQATADLKDATTPRNVELTDPHGFSATTQAIVRVDETGPVLTVVKVPTECSPDSDEVLEYASDKPLAGFASKIEVQNGQVTETICQDQRVVIRIHTARAEQDAKNVRLAWTFQVLDRTGNRSRPVTGSCAMLTNEWVNSLGMKFRRIPAGSFSMGSEKGYPDEKPVRKVEIQKPFYLGVCEVTQAQWDQVMERNPSSFKGPNRPVETVSWPDVMEFIQRLSEKDGVTYRLPTEEEWEYACRAGTTTEYYWGDEMNGDHAWFWDNAGKETHPVGLKKPNAWGFHDMSGNVFEWCESGLKERTRLARGGSWEGNAGNCRSARRQEIRRTTRKNTVGFRLAR